MYERELATAKELALAAGLRIMEVFPRSNQAGWKGRIYDPNEGNTYRCNLELKGENVLKFRGYVGITLFGRTTHWTRVESAAANGSP